MMKKRLFLMTALMLISGASMAQKVLDKVEAGGKVIIDCRTMPAKAITKLKKPRNVADGITTAETNKTVSHYFEVMKTDLSDEGVVWTSAISNCAKYESGDGNNTWRLPTQRELMLIFTLRRTLNLKAGLTMLKVDYYWSATERDTSSSWAVYFNYGNANYYNKSWLYQVRCVRDLTPPPATKAK